MDTFFKKSFYIGTRLSQVLGSHFPRHKTNKIIFTPAFENEQELADHVNRIKWYLPVSANSTIWISLSERLKSIDLNNLAIPEHQRSPSGTTSGTSIKIYQPEELNRHLKDADLICTWNVEKTALWKHFLRHPLKTRILDPNFYRYTESHTNAALLWYDLLSRQEKKRHNQNINK